MILTPKQEQAVKIIIERFRNKEKYTVLAGFAGSGKAQPNDTQILTPNGYTTIGELKVGDYVYDRKGKPTKVLQIFPQGKLKKYKVTLADGRTTYCNNEHLWSYYTSKGNLKTVTLQHIIDSGLQNAARQWKFKIPMNQPIEYSEQIYNVDPYVIGAFLGDGCCKGRQLMISSADEELVQEISNLIGAKKYKRNSEYNYSWIFELQEPEHLPNNVLKTTYQTKDLFSDFSKEMMCGAAEKRIPKIYKIGSIEQRLNLLQGLLDTDGTISIQGNRYNIRFTSISKGLIDDIREVLFSLGYSSTVTTDTREEKYTTGICYNLSINIPNEEKEKLFRLSRKKEIAIQAKEYKKRRDYWKIGISKVEELKEEVEMTCIMVDNDEHLYLTNDFIVTHNTVTISHVLSALPVDPKRVCYACFTGKAVQRLKEVGIKNDVFTLHKLLYKFTPSESGYFIKEPKLHIDYDVVIVDEVSMADKELIEQLFSHKVYVICCGDPFQLPPVDPETDNHLLDKPHIFLDEVLRQAQESEIIRLSMDIRNGKPLQLMKGKDALIIDKSDLTTGCLEWADQIICATNKTKDNIIKTIRQMQGRGLTPEIGEKIIAMRNYWEILSSEGEPLTNGAIGTIVGISPEEITLPRNFYQEPYTVYRMKLEVPEPHQFFEIIVDKNFLFTGKKTLDWRKEGRIKRSRYKWAVPCECSFGSVISCHKSQGSEWKNVLIIEEGFPFSKIEHAKWLYTAVTRASEKLILVRK